MSRKPNKDGQVSHATKPRKERRSGRDRRRGDDRRSRPDRRSGLDRRRSEMTELYQSDIDRHLWSWASPWSRKDRRRTRRRGRKLLRVVASAAGAVGAAGLSYLLLRGLRKDEDVEAPERTRNDVDEADVG